MSGRDYAAPIKQERRRSIWDWITGNDRSSIDWNSAPPLTAGLREQFPHLLRSQPPVDDSPPAPPVPDALQSGYDTVRAADQRRARTDSIQGDTLHSNRRRAAQAVAEAGDHRQQPRSRLSSRQSRSHQDDGQPKPAQVAARAQQPPVRPRSPLWCADLYEEPRPAPTIPAHFVPRPFHQRHDTRNIIHQRNAQGQLFTVPHSPRSPSHEQTIRRRQPQSSLRKQVHQDDDHRAGDGSTTNVMIEATPALNRNPISGNGGYSHYPIYSPLPSTEPHALPQLSRSSSAARLASSTHIHVQISPHSTGSRKQNPDHPSITELRGFADSPTTTSLSLMELQELEGSLLYNPPEFPQIPLPVPPYTGHPGTDRAGSTTSIATFENPNPSSPPLSRIQAQLAGLKQHLRDPQSLKVKAIKIAKRVKPKSKELWYGRVEWKMKLSAKIDVLAFGPQLGCMCSVCVKKRGQDLMMATCTAHHVPDATDWRTEVQLHESGYGRLAFWEF